MLTFVLHTALRGPPVEGLRLRAKDKRLNIQEKTRKEGQYEGQLCTADDGHKTKKKAVLFTKEDYCNTT